jgi:gliding motility-associated-like protein
MRFLLLIWFILSSFLGFSQSPNDCDNAILICGNINFGLDPDGVGFDEFSLPGNIVPPCYSFNNSTVWLRFVIEESGEFTFDLLPDNAQADYDFAIFGPNVDCTNLGMAIRCSSTNPQSAGVPAATGLNLEETDFFEGPGPDGNGYLQYIDALAGEEYYMVIGRPHGSGAFSIQMTGEAQLPDQPTAYPIEDLSDCEKDDIIDGLTFFDLDILIPQIIQAQTNVTVTFHQSLNDANIGINSLVSPYMNTSNPMTIFYRIESNLTECFDISDFEIKVEMPFEVSLPENLFVCDNLIDTVVLETESGYAYYEWSTGQQGPNLNSIEVSISGDYWVVVTDSLGCKVQANTTVFGSSAATIIDIEVKDFRGTGNTITVIVEGSGDYEFALDNDNIYQDSNVFTEVSYGYHTVYIRDKKGCGVVSEEVLVLDYPKFFTPNNDGFHDTWLITGIHEFPITKIYIYNRYGKLLTQLRPLRTGWDGTYHGRPLPSSDYWFSLHLEDGRVYKGNFTLKR